MPGPIEKTSVVVLEENYRSTQPILDATNLLISRAEADLFADRLHHAADHDLRVDRALVQLEPAGVDARDVEQLGEAVGRQVLDELRAEDRTERPVGLLDQTDDHLLPVPFNRHHGNPTHRKLSTEIRWQLGRRRRHDAPVEGGRLRPAKHCSRTDYDRARRILARTASGRTRWPTRSACATRPGTT